MKREKGIPSIGRKKEGNHASETSDNHRAASRNAAIGGRRKHLCGGGRAVGRVILDCSEMDSNRKKIWGGNSSKLLWETKSRANGRIC